MTGYKAEEFIQGKVKWNKLILAEDFKKIQDGWKRLSSKACFAIEREYRIRKKNSKIIWVRDTVQSVCNASGKPMYFQGLLYDITGRKVAQEKLRKSEERMRLLLENSPDYIAIVDKKGVIQFVNRLMPGFKEKDVLGKTIYSFQPPKLRDKKLLRRVFRTGKPETVVALVYGLKNTKRWLEIRIAPIKEDGRIDSAMFITTDITALKTAEEKIQKESDAMKKKLDALKKCLKKAQG
jgi:PAS domain S-box-containing protein